MNYGKRAKRRIRVGLFMVLLLGALSFCTFSSCAAKSSKKIALNKTCVSTTKGRSVQLKLLNAKGNATWKTNKKSVATVSKSGKVAGVSKGTCKITAKYKGKTYRCTVKVYNTTKAYLSKTLKKVYSTSKYQDRILLAGSSSVEYWSTAASAFAPWKTLNMGIAGTKVTNWEKLYKSLIVPYDPKAVVLYAGSNDIGDGICEATGAETAAETRRLIQKIQKSLPDTPIFYVSICPSLKRDEAWRDIRICNKKMKAYCAGKKNVYYIDVASYFWEDGKLNPALYSSDRLHLSKKGYKIWNSVIGPRVKRILKARK